MKHSTKKLTTLAVTVSVAMVLSFIESRIPAFVAIPGIKVGLANIAVIFAMYKLGEEDAIIISGVRVILVSMLFGSTLSLLYSYAGAMLSFSVMVVLRRVVKMNTVGVSIAGGVSHNIGQIAVACIVMETNVIVYYLPYLILSGIIAGIAVGAAAVLLIRRVKI